MDDATRKGFLKGNTFRENEEKISLRFHIYMHAFVHYLSIGLLGRCVQRERLYIIHITIIY